MSSITKKIKEASSYREDIEDLELSIGHVPAYDEEQESEVITRMTIYFDGYRADMLVGTLESIYFPLKDF